MRGRGAGRLLYMAVRAITAPYARAAPEYPGTVWIEPVRLIIFVGSAARHGADRRGQSEKRGSAPRGLVCCPLNAVSRIGLAARPQLDWLWRGSDERSIVSVRWLIFACGFFLLRFAGRLRCRMRNDGFLSTVLFRCRMIFHYSYEKCRCFELRLQYVHENEKDPAASSWRVSRGSVGMHRIWSDTIFKHVSAAFLKNRYLYPKARRIHIIFRT